MNTSHAVRAQRHEPNDSLDDYPTPIWPTRALLEQIEPLVAPGMVCREPAAGRGYMAGALVDLFSVVEASDVHEYGGMAMDLRDYLAGDLPPPVDWTITNPPFRLAERFIDRALATSRVGVAMLCRTTFIEGIGRHGRLFDRKPPTHLYQFAERVPMHKGKLTATGSTATAYCWLVWIIDLVGQETALRWIAPCRARLERPEDYQP